MSGRSPSRSSDAIGHSGWKMYDCKLSGASFTKEFHSYIKAPGVELPYRDFFGDPLSLREYFSRMHPGERSWFRG